MAGEWIKIDVNLDEKPRVLRLSDELSIDPLHVVGMLWKIWAWADTHSVDGCAVSVTESHIDGLVRRTGFSKALRAVGWLAGKDYDLTFPRFEEHNGKTAKNRALAAKRMRVSRYADVALAAQPEQEREKTDTVRPFVASDHLDSWTDAYARALAASKRLWPRRPPKQQDRDLLKKAAFLSIALFSEDWLADAVEGTVRKAPRNPAAYLKRILAETARRRGHELNQLLDSITIPAKPQADGKAVAGVEQIGAMPGGKP